MSGHVAVQREDRDKLLSSLPALYGGDLRAEIKKRVSDAGSQIPLLVILDDVSRENCRQI